MTDRVYSEFEVREKALNLKEKKAMYLLLVLEHQKKNWK